MRNSSTWKTILTLSDRKLKMAVCTFPSYFSFKKTNYSKKQDWFLNLWIDPWRWSMTIHPTKQLGNISQTWRRLIKHETLNTRKQNGVFKEGFHEIVITPQPGGGWWRWQLGGVNTSFLFQLQLTMKEGQKCKVSWRGHPSDT